MDPIRIHRRLDSDTLHLPELKPFVGKDVQIIVCEDSAKSGKAKRGELEPFFAAAGKNLIDPAAVDELRRASIV